MQRLANGSPYINVTLRMRLNSPLMSVIPANDPNIVEVAKARGLKQMLSELLLQETNEKAEALTTLIGLSQPLLADAQKKRLKNVIGSAESALKARD